MKDKFSNGQSACQTIVDTVAEPIFVIGPDFRIIEANRAASLAFGVTREELIGRACHKVTHRLERPCHEHGVMCPVRGVLETGKQVRVLHQHALPGGRFGWEEAIATPVRDEHGKILYIVEELRDVTELLKARKAIDELGKEVKVLMGLLPICANCKKIRNEQGEWEITENYIQRHSEADFTHGLCPDCVRDLYPMVPQDDQK